MKRYLVFAGSFYYPDGGADDFAFDTDDITDAETRAVERLNKVYEEHGTPCWVHVYDADVRKVCRRWEIDYRHGLRVRKP